MIWQNSTDSSPHSYVIKKLVSILTIFSVIHEISQNEVYTLYIHFTFLKNFYLTAWWKSCRWTETCSYVTVNEQLCWTESLCIYRYGYYDSTRWQALKISWSATLLSSFQRYFLIIKLATCRSHVFYRKNGNKNKAIQGVSSVLSEVNLKSPHSSPHPLTTKQCDCLFFFCIVKATKCASFSNLFYFVVPLYMFRTVFPSIIRSLRLYIQHQFHLVPASKQSAESVWHTPDAVCIVLDSWWWTERPSETCRVLLQNKINLKNWCISLV